MTTPSNFAQASRTAARHWSLRSKTFAAVHASMSIGMPANAWGSQSRTRIGFIVFASHSVSVSAMVIVTSFIYTLFFLAQMSSMRRILPTPAG